MSQEPQQSWFATTPKGMESLLADELTHCNAAEIKPNIGGVAFKGDQEVALRACLWSRLANRVLLPLATFIAHTPDELYAGCEQVNWTDIFQVQHSFAIDATLSRSKIRHSRYAEQTVKDAIADQFRHRFGHRPDVDREQPDIRINLFVTRDRATLSLDLSGESLHRRGYRLEAVEAPLKENLAAAILLRAGWPKIAASGGALYDPMCGSGTLLIEGAMMAADIAPGLHRSRHGFEAWKDFNPAIWQRLIKEAEYRREQGLEKLPPIAGSDKSIKAAGIAKANARAAGLAPYLQIEGKPLAQVEPKPDWGKGLLVTNPPYGERLSEVDALKPLYAELGTLLQQRFEDWHATVFTDQSILAFEIPLRAHKSYALYNGALACKAYNFEVIPDRFFEAKPQHQSPAEKQAKEPALKPAKGPWTNGAQMLANRLRKNQRKLRPWLKKQHINCYRLYDADLPEYAVAVDVYQSDSLWVHVQEYEAPKTIDPEKAKQRLREVLAVVPDVLQIPYSQMVLKVRKRQKGSQQYDRQDQRGNFHEVQEGPCRLLINLHDYLDTGLFLDHRNTRQMIGKWAAGSRFLNLFAYTATATVHAALGGALTSTSVDLSRTYLDWAQHNFELNDIEHEAHQLVQQDCGQWLAEAIEKQRLFDLIFIDPPTFSNSKRMDDVFDVQRDHVAIIKEAMKLLHRDGRLIFSTNARTFKIDQQGLSAFSLENLHRPSLPRDFERNPKIHACWLIRHTTAQL